MTRPAPIEHPAWNVIGIADGFIFEVCRRGTMGKTVWWHAQKLTYPGAFIVGDSKHRTRKKAIEVARRWLEMTKAREVGT